MAKQEIKVGDKVRVGRESDVLGPIHGVKFGAVAVVEEISLSILHVRGPVGEGWWPVQGVEASQCKLAKQAMKVKA